MLSDCFRDSLPLRQLPMFRRPKAPKLINTDDQVDCTPYDHVMYRPTCQTIRLEKRRRAAMRERRKKLPTILENLCMFEWLHRTDAYKSMSNEELLFVLLNGLYHQDKGNVAIVINKDQISGKSATSRMEAAFGKAENKKDAVKNFMTASNSPQVRIEVPTGLKALNVAEIMKASTSGVVRKSDEPSTSSARDDDDVVVLD